MIKTYCILSHSADFDMYDIQIEIPFSTFEDLSGYIDTLYDYALVEDGLYARFNDGSLKLISRGHSESVSIYKVKDESFHKFHIDKDDYEFVGYDVSSCFEKITSTNYYLDYKTLDFLVHTNHIEYFQTEDWNLLTFSMSDWLSDIWSEELRQSYMNFENKSDSATLFSIFLDHTNEKSFFQIVNSGDDSVSLKIKDDYAANMDKPNIRLSQEIINVK